MATIEMKEMPSLFAEELRRMNAYWHTATSLSGGRIILYDNLLLREPLKLASVIPAVRAGLS